MQHPLENPSLAPFGFVSPRYKERLRYKPTGSESWVNEEVLIGKFWAEWNRSKPGRSRPITTIIHDILPSQAKANHLVEGDFWFDDYPYRSSDIILLSTIVQWFGTNVGRSYLLSPPTEHPWRGAVKEGLPEGFHPEREFLLRFKHDSARRDFVVFWAHQCTEKCGSEFHRAFTGNSCYFVASDASPRDRAVTEGLMRWLGRKEGRHFIQEYRQRLERARRARYEKVWKEHT